MDHNNDHNHHTPEGSEMCPMIMTFHGGHCERILWNGWLATTITEFSLSALAIFLTAFLYEAVKFLRVNLLRQNKIKENERIAQELQKKQLNYVSNNGNRGIVECPRSTMIEFQQKTYSEKIFASAHLIQTCLNVIQIIVSYHLMLIFMTFNYWLCFAVILGLGCGYFFFGWINRDIYDSECCQ